MMAVGLGETLVLTVGVGAGVGYKLARNDSIVVMCARLQLALTGVHVAFTKVGEDVDAELADVSIATAIITAAAEAPVPASMNPRPRAI
jgi:hypothetical protein